MNWLRKLDKKTVKQIGNIEAQYSSCLTENIQIVDDNSIQFKKFFELIKAAQIEENKTDEINSIQSNDGNPHSAASQCSIDRALQKQKEMQQQEENEEKILYDCSLLGITLPEVNTMNIPRFTCPINKINYGALISKAFYFSWRESNLKIPSPLKKKKTGITSTLTTSSHGLDVSSHALVH